MGKMSELDAQIQELRSCGETILSIANSLAEMFSSQVETPAPEKAKPEPEPPSLEDVRHRLTLLAQAGHSAEVKELITRYGAKKLSDVEPAKFEALLRDADAIGRDGGV